MKSKIAVCALVLILCGCHRTDETPWTLVKQRDMENYGYVQGNGSIKAGFRTKDEARKELEQRHYEFNHPPKEIKHESKSLFEVVE